MRQRATKIRESASVIADATSTSQDFQYGENGFKLIR